MDEILNYYNNIYLPFMSTYKNSDIIWDDLLDLIKSDYFKEHKYNLMDMSVTRLKKIESKWIYFQNLNKRVLELPIIDYDSIVTFNDGFEWRLLKSQNSYNNEGSVMESCVATYFNHENSLIYSLRNEKNESKLTVEYNKSSNSIIQAKRRKNQEIKFSKKYSNYLCELFNKISASNTLAIRFPEIYSLHKVNERFLPINENSEINAHNFTYNIKLGKIKSINCNTFIIKQEDFVFIKTFNIKANKLIIKYNPNKEETTIPENWIITTIEYEKQYDFFPDIDFGWNYIITGNMGAGLVNLNRLAELTAICRPGILKYQLNTFHSIDNEILKIKNLQPIKLNGNIFIIDSFSDVFNKLIELSQITNFNDVLTTLELDSFDVNIFPNRTILKSNLFIEAKRKQNEIQRI